MPRIKGRAFPIIDSPHAVYTAADEEALSRQLRRSWIAAWVYAAILAAAMIPTLVLRLQWATILVTVALGGLGIFLWGMKITPALSYRKHLREIHSGLSRDVEGWLERVDNSHLTFREGIDCYAFVVNVGDSARPDPKHERLLYWDAQKPFPDWRVGDTLRATAHGNDVITLQVSRDMDRGGLS
ncbi:MAG: hypothetical protein LBH66_09570 [Oscillospiraceae bacterium]|jgi:hypothetical protein|nr:hypothetical protein [Oscillospiraceae bacterium]